MPTTATTVSVNRKKAVKKSKAVETFNCEFCKKAFVNEKAFLVHICEQKRRFLNQDEKHVKLGFWVYKKFHEINYRYRTERKYEQFAKSSHYVAFIKFGRYLLDINAINPFGFAEFLIRAAIPINKWSSPVVYETYVRELNKKESPSAALERNFLLIEQWALETGEPWTDFFRKVKTPLATSWIRSGRISPWVLYTASSANDLLSRLSDEQMSLIQEALDPQFWAVKLDQHSEDVKAIQAELDACGI